MALPLDRKRHVVVKTEESGVFRVWRLNDAQGLEREIGTVTLVDGGQGCNVRLDAGICVFAYRTARLAKACNGEIAATGRICVSNILTEYWLLQLREDFL